MLLVSLLSLGLSWRLIELFVVSHFGCGELLRFWYGEAPLGPTLLGVFAVAFTAMFCLWIINLIRVRYRRPAVWATTVQAFLFVAILTVLTTWSSFISPYSVFKPVSDTLRYSFFCDPDGVIG
jgi:fluoride ion exporter CrcB/FEX